MKILISEEEYYIRKSKTESVDMLVDPVFYVLIFLAYFIVEVMK